MLAHQRNLSYQLSGSEVCQNANERLKREVKHLEYTKLNIIHLVVEAYIVLLNVQIFYSCFLFIFFFNLCSFMYFNLGSCSLYCISSIFHSGEIFEF